MTTNPYPIPASMRRQARIVIVGHVDHGKSTLIGRLLNDTQSLPDGKVEAVREMSRRRGMPFEWSFVMDALQAERDQGITIDTTQIHFRTKQRPYVIIDAPGHTEFLKNMVTGASSADAALLVIDAGEGALEQSRRHAYLLHLLGVKQVAVIVNKMDMVEFSQNRFDDVSAEIRAYLNEIGVAPGVIVPISARHGDNVVAPSENLPWFKGPTLVEALDAFKPVASEDELPLRMPIQDVYKPDERRILAGRIETGVSASATRCISRRSTGRRRSSASRPGTAKPRSPPRPASPSASRWTSASSSSAAISPASSTSVRSSRTG